MPGIYQFPSAASNGAVSGCNEPLRCGHDQTSVFIQLVNFTEDFATNFLLSRFAVTHHTMTGTDEC